LKLDALGARLDKCWRFNTLMPSHELSDPSDAPEGAGHWQATDAMAICNGSLSRFLELSRPKMFGI